jgi:hypothetical protein
VTFSAIAWQEELSRARKVERSAPIGAGTSSAVLGRLLDFPQHEMNLIIARCDCAEGGGILLLPVSGTRVRSCPCCSVRWALAEI